MFIASFPAGPWQTSCYVLAVAAGTECVVVDPGMDALGGVEALVAEHRLRPVAVVLTHGHLDHMGSVAPLCARYQAPCWVHPADRGLLVDPLAGMGPDAAALLARLTGDAQAGGRFTEPADVRELVDGATVSAAGIELAALHAPGHTPGSTMLRCAYEPPTGAARGGLDSLLLSGDVLFAGTVGRTDLPGGDAEVMRATLRDVVLPLPDTVAVLPGHGAQTTMAAERAGNPFLQAGFLEAGSLGSVPG